jgi:23S rRNA (guanine2445-N2)-methyltransferase / 23S rRNA (guanine2069-N7)-methyltransferase
LDHRITRQRIGAMAKGKHFLNLFAYTGSATVYAAGGGAASTTTVDMSNTYIDWAKRNMSINHFAGRQHEFIQTDVLQWLDTAGARSKSGLQPSAFNLQPAKYDLIFVDPPTFSRSKRMVDTFDVQRDHAQLLRLVARSLAPSGSIFFSNNFMRFKLDREALDEFSIADISRETVPRDFERNPKIHQCFVLTKKIAT